MDTGHNPNQERLCGSAVILMVEVVSSGRVTIMSCTLSQFDSAVVLPTSSSQSCTCSMIISSKSTRLRSSVFNVLQILFFRSIELRVVPMKRM